MQRIFTLILLGIFLIICSCSSSSVSIEKHDMTRQDSLPSIIEKWKHATIHLECAVDSKSLDEQMKIFNEQVEGLRKNEMVDYDFSNHNYSGRNIRYRGTALFIKYKNKKFLVTVRHILHDTLQAKRYIEENLERLILQHLEIEVDDSLEIIKKSEKIIFSKIFRVMSWNELYSRKDNSPINEFLMNLGSGPESFSQYTFSEPNIDLAVISLERQKNFVKDLEANGYSSIQIDSMWNTELQEGDNLFCIGYPQTTSELVILSLRSAIKNWRSPVISLPTISFGKVAMFHDSLTFFWGDMSVYPGNSGGPVISQNRLVGLISAQPTLEGQRVPFAGIIKIDYLKSLLDEQIRKDKSY